jgi:hypothetical protein
MKNRKKRVIAGRGSSSERKDMSVRSLLVWLLVGLLLVGCGPSLEQRIVGTWKADMDRTVLPAAGAARTARGVRQALGATTLVLSEDGTYNLRSLQEAEGNWVLTGNQLTLESNDVRLFGSRRQEIDFIVDGEGRTLTLELPTQQGVLRLILRKAD